jgi:hypothetical protein
MLKTRRGAASGITAATSALAMLALAVPAQAIPTPAWPTAGRIPTGCTAPITISGSPSDWHYEYTDTTVPTISDVLVGAGASSITVVPPTGAAVKVSAKVNDACGGVGFAGVNISLNGTIITGASLGPTTTDAFSGWWTMNVGTLPPDDAVGIWKLPIGIVARRYDGFVLDKAFKVVGIPVATATSNAAIVGAWALKPFYYVRAMTLSNTLSATKIAKGKTVKATAILKMATNTGYVPDASDKVVVQTKVGTGKWISNATVTTNASGVATYSFVLTATTQVRFVHNRVLSGKFTNAVTSAIKTVTKA